MQKQGVLGFQWSRWFLFLLVILCGLGSAQAGEKKVIAKDIYLNLVAAHIRQAIGDGHHVLTYVDTMTGFYGDKVNFEVDFDPKSKRVINGPAQRVQEQNNFRYLIEKMPDYHQEDTDVQVAGDSIILKETMVGTLPSGKVSRVSSVMTFTFGDDGKITDQLDHWKLEDAREILDILHTMPGANKKDY
jgi:hypothetical protein